MLGLMKKAAFTLAIVGSAVGARVADAQSLIKIDGSSTVYPITEAVAEEFQKTNKEREGHGRHLRHGRRVQEVRPRRDRHRGRLAPDQGGKEMEEAKTDGIEFIELPVAFDALTRRRQPEQQLGRPSSPSTS